MAPWQLARGAGAGGLTMSPTLLRCWAYRRVRLAMSISQASELPPRALVAPRQTLPPTDLEALPGSHRPFWDLMLCVISPVASPLLGTSWVPPACACSRAPEGLVQLAPAEDGNPPRGVGRRLPGGGGVQEKKQAQFLCLGSEKWGQQHCWPHTAPSCGPELGGGLGQQEGTLFGFPSPRRFPEGCGATHCSALFPLHC